MNVSELTGAALDWAVSVAELDTEDGLPPPPYSTDWAQGGPIIEREHIEIRPTITEGGYRTSSSVDAIEARIMLPNGVAEFDPSLVVSAYAPTSLIAAMRCYVTSKLGDEIYIPKELK